jgi:uroporphyrinogen-III synthase
VLRAVLYDAVPRTAFSQPAAAAINRGAIDAATFFSPRTAAAFVSLMEAARIEGTCRGIAAACLSPAVAAALERLAWREVAVAASPDQAALLAALDGLRVTGA